MELLSHMTLTDQFQAVDFWNDLSERLQQMVNDSLSQLEGKSGNEEIASKVTSSSGVTVTPYKEEEENDKLSADEKNKQFEESIRKVSKSSNFLGIIMFMANRFFSVKIRKFLSLYSFLLMGQESQIKMADILVVCNLFSRI